MSTSPRSGRIRTLSASSRARREKRRAMTKRRRFAAGGVVLAALVAAPLSITALMGVDSNFPGLDAAKSLMALLEDRSPGDRTAAELTKTKKKPEQRALGKVTKPKPPEEFIQAIAPPPPALSDLPTFPVAVAGLGPLVDIPPPRPGGGGGIITFDGPPGGGGGGPPGGDDDNPPVNPPPENPPENPPPPVVPEPATWASMLLGFGVTGLVIRRRRRTERLARA